MLHGKGNANDFRRAKCPRETEKVEKGREHVKEEAGDTRVTDVVNGNDVITDFDYKLFNVIDRASGFFLVAEREPQGPVWQSDWRS